MTARDFCFWLQGFFEVGDATGGIKADHHLDAKQMECIQRHLAMVFQHDIDPSMGDAKHQAALNKTHAIGGKDAHGKVLRC